MVCAHHAGDDDGVDGPPLEPFPIPPTFHLNERIGWWADPRFTVWRPTVEEMETLICGGDGSRSLGLRETVSDEGEAYLSTPFRHASVLTCT